MAPRWVPVSAVSMHMRSSCCKWTYSCLRCSDAVLDVQLEVFQRALCTFGSARLEVDVGATVGCGGAVTSASRSVAVTNLTSVFAQGNGGDSPVPAANGHASPDSRAMGGANGGGGGNWLDDGRWKALRRLGSTAGWLIDPTEVRAQ